MCSLSSSVVSNCLKMYFIFYFCCLINWKINNDIPEGISKKKEGKKLSAVMMAFVKFNIGFCPNQLLLTFLPFKKKRKET